MSDNPKAQMRSSLGACRVLECRLALVEAQHELTHALKEEVEKAWEREVENFSKRLKDLEGENAALQRDLSIAEAEVAVFKEFLNDRKLLEVWREYQEVSF